MRGSMHGRGPTLAQAAALVHALVCRSHDYSCIGQMRVDSTLPHGHGAHLDAWEGSQENPPAIACPQQPARTPRICTAAHSAMQFCAATVSGRCAGPGVTTEVDFSTAVLTDPDIYRAIAPKNGKFITKMV